MINQRDVIRMKVPYPTVSDSLALKAHMYICRVSGDSYYEFVKCQTLKPYMLINNTMTHYWDEQPDISRNPFTRTTRIDCDKTFKTYSVIYDDALKATARPDVCEEVFNSVENELVADGYEEIDVPEDDLKMLNSLIQ